MTAHAAGILLTHGDRALFLKRSPDARDHQGEWCCPGGSIEAGETPEQAAHREFAEETGAAGLLTGNLNQIDEGDGFVTFRANVDAEFTPTLNEEHTEARWASLDDPPQPLHPGVAATLKKLLREAAQAGQREAEAQRQAKVVLAAAADSAAAAAAMAQDRREWDHNGWFEVLDNPLSKVGVYQYSEASVNKGGDRTKMVGVYRPAEELGSEECVHSFRLMPWTDDHPDDLFGDASQGFASTEEKGIRGVIGEKVYFKGDTLYGNLKIFSEDLARKIAAGKRELSCGYHCQFVPQEGTFNGEPYQYVQRNMRGNHISSVKSGRMGSEVRVLDSVEMFTFAVDLKEPPMAKRDDEIKDCLDAETEKFIGDSFNSLVGELEKKGYSKEYATKVAGKVAAEKGKTGHDSKSIGDITVATKTDEEIKKEAADRKSARDSKRSARDSARAKDSLSAEEEEGMDAEEAAEDAEEEKDDEKDDSKEAKDRGRARDRRAGARDARKGARDAKSARDAKAALDAANKGKGMDAAAVTEMVNKAVAAAIGGKALDAAEITKQVAAAVVPAIRKEESAKAALYGRISPVIGAFDHSEMTHTQMAAYGLKKLGVAEPPADPVMALDFMLAGRNQVAQPGARAALDSATPSSTDAFFDSLN